MGRASNEPLMGDPTLEVLKSCEFENWKLYLILTILAFSAYQAADLKNFLIVLKVLLQQKIEFWDLCMFGVGEAGIFGKKMTLKVKIFLKLIVLLAISEYQDSNKKIRYFLLSQSSASKELLTNVKTEEKKTNKFWEKYFHVSKARTVFAD